MNKFIKIMPAFVLVLFVLAFTFVPVFGATGVSTDFPDASGSIGKINNSAKKIWGTVTTIVQILAFAAVVFAGLRYMFASADQKADIKKGLGMLTIGAVLVFAASTVVKFIVGAAGDVLKL